MQNEISSGTMLGIVLIALAAVIGLGFGVFAIAKGVANEGTVNVQDNLGTVSESAFEDYNDKVVTGTQVVAAYKQFEGKPVAILINTQALTKGVKNYPNHTVFVHDIGTLHYINYNAILAGDSTGAAPTKVTGSPAGAAITTGTTTTLTINAANSGLIDSKVGFHIDSANGKVVFDSTTGGYAKAGNCEYISTSAKYTALLVKDASQTTVGIAFQQLAK